MKLSKIQSECCEFINNQHKNILVYGHCRSGKTFALIANLVIDVGSINLICVSSPKAARLLVQYYIEPICADFGIYCKFIASSMTVVLDKSEIHFAFAPYKDIYYPRYDTTIIFGKSDLGYKEYLELSRKSDKIILEENPFNSENKKDIDNNCEDWVYTYFVRGLLPYQGENEIKSGGVMFQLNNQESLPESVVHIRNNLPETLKKYYLDGEFDELK